VVVAESGSNAVSIIDTGSNAVVATIAVGNGPVAFGQFIGPALGQLRTLGAPR
jgi:YVTN family beta-propeller protein